METDNNQTTPQSSSPRPQHTSEKVIQPLDPNLKAEPAPPPTPPVPGNTAPSGPAVTPAQTPVPVPQTPPVPAAQPARQAAPQYQSPSPPVGFSQADALAQEEKLQHKRRLRIGSGIFAGLIVLVVAGFIAYSLLSGFKTVTYDNGRGASFRLKFYSRYTVKATPGASNGFQELASKVSHQGLYPLVISITKGTTQKPSSALLNCSGNGTTPALQVTNKPTSSTVNLCSEGQDQSAKPIIYLGVLHSGDHYYAILINQDLNFPQLISNPQKAQAGLKKVDLSVYNDDITTIVSSIKPLQ
jgi:hypothetical protein